MQYEFFRVSVDSPEHDAVQLNQFLSSHKIVHIDKQFFVRDGTAFWSFCVHWLSVEPEAVDRRSNSNRIDYKKLLPESQFAIFSSLREHRKLIAEREGIPVYAVATNEQLAEMAKMESHSLSELQAISGFGEAKVERYGASFLEALKKFPGNDHAEASASGT